MADDDEKKTQNESEFKTSRKHSAPPHTHQPMLASFSWKQLAVTMNRNANAESVLAWMEKDAPIVFLDVDGVICLDGGACTLLPVAMRALQSLCAVSSAVVVVSSDWRRDKTSLKRLQKALADLGIRCIGSTPQRSRGQELRPVEIREWFEPTIVPSTRAWVALDDRHLPGETGGSFVQPINFVHIDPRNGLTPALAGVALRKISLQQRCISATGSNGAAPPAGGPYPWVWVDVDGTSETGEPTDYASREANKAQAPVGRSFNYNEPLFNVLRQRVRCPSLLLFTAYDAQGGASFGHAMRVELCEWLETHHGYYVEGVATPLDALYARGIGAYYRDVIEPCERAVLAAEAGSDVEGGRLDPGAAVVLGTGEETTVGEVLRRESSMYERHCRQFNRPPNKATLATYCLRLLLQQPPFDNVVVFLDDKREYLEQVQCSCTSLGVTCHLVHVVTTTMVDEASYEAALLKSGLRLVSRGSFIKALGLSARSTCAVS